MCGACAPHGAAPDGDVVVVGALGSVTAVSGCAPPRVVVVVLVDDVVVEACGFRRLVVLVVPADLVEPPLSHAASAPASPRHSRSATARRRRVETPVIPLPWSMGAR